ncbi:MAG: restriction endonuclease subunit S [Ruminococcus bromii]|nr:restriction endonuclease subunit S [Ruminococcus bromii]
MKPEIKQRIEQLNNGKIPKGYQKTDFGVFPSDWETDKTLGDLFDFYGGLSKSRDELGEEGYAYLHYGDLHRGTFNSASIDQYEQLPKCDISLTGKEMCLMKDGDVAFLDASEDLEGTSRAVLIDNPENKPFIAGLHIIYGKAKNHNLDKWFKQYITSSESVKKQFQRLAVGFKVYGVNRDTISRIKVAFPSSQKEQSRIADILMKWDEAIELYDKQIDALTRYKKVCLKKMFPAKGQNVPEWRFQGFTDAWEQRKLGDLLQTLPFKQFLKEPEPDGKYEIIQQGNEPVIGFANGTPCGDYKDVVIFGDHTLSLYKPQHPFFVATDGVRIVKGQQDTDGYYLLSLLERYKPQSEGYKRYYSILADTNCITTYNTSEQEKIGVFFKQLDHLITLHQRKKEVITNQRKTLQQYLLNGIIRV